MSVPPKIVPCPRCRKPAPWADNPDRPFCSERCRLFDLGAWASEEYRVAGKPVDPELIENVIPFPKQR